MEDYGIRKATEQDVPLLLEFVRELADYEHLLDEVTASEEDFRSWMFKKRIAEAIIAECCGKPAGFALYFYNFSTFLGRAGLYVEDLYVRPDMRGRGIGRLLFERLAGICVEQGYGRLEWSVLNWNAPSIAFYRTMGGEPLTDWTTYRVAGDPLIRLSQKAAK